MMNRRGAAAAWRQGPGSYARVGVESDVLSASPHRLIEMLFDGALSAIRTARLQLENGDRGAKGLAISKALDIVNNGLLAALDEEQGGDIAAQLAAIYYYVGRLLLKANLHDDDDSLAEAGRLLEDIASAWRQIGAGRQAAGATEIREAIPDAGI
ncbi:flagellar export chaperone FliS [Parahaliea aestuarii]|uniref:Flagellar secretion chaperone FliS n=1 Tax=Parahaliea aestuarii TaxID=1852021 RepID=A0A5C9A1N8_9GAMM|nr:flagellar export chaperone FliS [Parahaliea aestuarii]TXS94795.1 flagellar export chaperone FliS [Parahaliea aestuarii]